MHYIAKFGLGAAVGLGASSAIIGYRMFCEFCSELNGLFNDAEKSLAERVDPTEVTPTKPRNKKRRRRRKKK